MLATNGDDGDGTAMGEGIDTDGIDPEIEGDKEVTSSEDVVFLLSYP